MLVDRAECGDGFGGLIGEVGVGLEPELVLIPQVVNGLASAGDAEYLTEALLADSVEDLGDALGDLVRAWLRPPTLQLDLLHV